MVPHEPHSPTIDAEHAACVRCHEIHAIAQMTRLTDGRLICHDCEVALRAVRSQGTQSAAGAQESGTPGTLAAAPPETADYDEPDMDEVPCPKCGEMVIFGLPTCDSCGIILDDFWDEESVRHPVNPVKRLVRVGLRIEVLAALVGVALYLVFSGRGNKSWRSLLPDQSPQMGQALGEEALGAEIHPLITRTGRKLIVKNGDNFDWGNVQISLNGARGSPGYTLTVQHMRHDRTVEYPLRIFTLPDGREFPQVGVPITNVEIRAETADGFALWTKEFIDATEAASPE